MFATLFLFQILMNYASAQLLSGNDIVGKWEVADIQVHIESDVPDFEEKMLMVKEGFMGKQFDFAEDHHFRFNADFLEMGMKNGHWKFNENNKSYIIQEWEDRNTDAKVYMEIWVKNENERVFFIFDETGLVMEVKRV